MRKLLIKLWIFSGLLFGAVAHADVVDGLGIVDYVVDGDTYWVETDEATFGIIAPNLGVGSLKLADLQFKIRVMNINTPESVNPDPELNTADGEAASKFVQEELEDQVIHFRCNGVDAFDRALCSIYIDGRDYGKHLVRNGLSPYVTTWGHHPWDHAGYFDAEALAKREGRGMWQPE